eukprot:15453385-Alexandrium_andersonii.AAC.1
MPPDSVSGVVPSSILDVTAPNNVVNPYIQQQVVVGVCGGVGAGAAAAAAGAAGSAVVALGHADGDGSDR